jgi:hypothetical protein
MSIPGEPGAVKVACPVRRGGGETQCGCAPCPYLTDERPTGNDTPASRPCTMGQRPHPMVWNVPKDDRGWLVEPTSLKDVRGQPEIPPDRPGFREERIGSEMSHHLNTSAEYIVVNVGGSHMEMSSPSMKYASVGGVIVLGARESRVQGEGRQGIDAVLD